MHKATRNICKAEVSNLLHNEHQTAIEVYRVAEKMYIPITFIKVVSEGETLISTDTLVSLKDASKTIIHIHLEKAQKFLGEVNRVILNQVIQFIKHRSNTPPTRKLPHLERKYPLKHIH